MARRWGARGGPEGPRSQTWAGTVHGDLKDKGPSCGRDARTTIAAFASVSIAKADFVTKPCYNIRMRNFPTIIFLAPLIVLASCSPEAPEVDPAYRAEIETAWAEREARLTAQDGWLSLTGLFWLESGPNITGSAEDASVRLPDGAELVGSLHLGDDGVVTLLPDLESGLTINGEPASETELAADTSGTPDLLRSGRSLFYLIRRGERVGVRVKDPESAARREFTGLTHFPVNQVFRISAAFAPYPEPRKVAIPTVIGEPSIMLAPGLLNFEIDGEEVSLEPYVSSPEDTHLFMVFRDATSGIETYGAGRFLDAILTEGSSEVVLDFNLATNPPCAFTPFATCPLPTPENTLFVAITAGEQYSGATH